LDDIFLVLLVHFFGYFIGLFFNRISGFFRINRIGVNHDNPEKSCNPVKNNGWFILDTEFTERAAAARHRGWGGPSG
jgi:hypothetical protein